MLADAGGLVCVGDAHRERREWAAEKPTSVERVLCLWAERKSE